MEAGRMRRYVTGESFLAIGKGPYQQGANFAVG